MHWSIPEDDKVLICSLFYVGAFVLLRFFSGYSLLNCSTNPPMLVGTIFVRLSPEGEDGKATETNLLALIAMWHLLNEV